MAPRKGRWSWLYDVKSVISASRPPRIRVNQAWMSNNQTLPTPNPHRSANNTPVLTDSARRWRRDDVESVDLAIRTARTDWRSALRRKRYRTQSTKDGGACPRGLKRTPPEPSSGPPGAERPTRRQHPHDLQPQQFPTGFHKAAGLNRHSQHARGLKAALAADRSRPHGDEVAPLKPF
jgi:hypothetical protein